jgi:hypothetical protein
MVFSQDSYPLGNNLKKDIKLYKDLFDKSYLDSMYYYTGYISLYKKRQDAFINSGLNIYYIGLSGYTPRGVPMRPLKKPCKIPASVRILELWDIELPLPFDLDKNKYFLKKIIIRRQEIANMKDTVLLDFQNLESIETFVLWYKNEHKIPYIQFIPPPNLHILSTDIQKFITFFPETLEELYILRDSIYPHSITPLPNLWLISFGDYKPYPISEELINKPSLKNIKIVDTLTYADIELLAKRLQLDTLTLMWDKKNPYPENFKKLTNISVIKLDYHIDSGTMYRQRFIVASEIQNILPNTTILYKDRKIDYNNNRRSIDRFIKYEKRDKE